MRTIKQNLFWAFVYNSLDSTGGDGLPQSDVAAGAMADSVSVVTKFVEAKKRKSCNVFDSFCSDTNQKITFNCIIKTESI